MSNVCETRLRDRGYTSTVMDDYLEEMFSRESEANEATLHIVFATDSSRFQIGKEQFLARFRL